jgi:hypothetical protein
VSERVARVEINRRLKSRARFEQSVGRELIPVKASAQVSLESLRVVRSALGELTALFARELRN